MGNLHQWNITSDFKQLDENTVEQASPWSHQLDEL